MDVLTELYELQDSVRSLDELTLIFLIQADACARLKNWTGFESYLVMAQGRMDEGHGADGRGATTRGFIASTSTNREVRRQPAKLDSGRGTLLSKR